MNTPLNEEKDLHRIKLNLGISVSERMQCVSEIKNAMTMAIMLMVENEMISEGRSDPSFSWFQLIYLEANNMEEKLKEI